RSSATAPPSRPSTVPLTRHFPVSYSSNDTPAMHEVRTVAWRQRSARPASVDSVRALAASAWALDPTPCLSCIRRSGVGRGRAWRSSAARVVLEGSGGNPVVDEGATHVDNEASKRATFDRQAPTYAQVKTEVCPRRFARLERGSNTLRHPRSHVVL